MWLMSGEMRCCEGCVAQKQSDSGISKVSTRPNTMILNIYAQREDMMSYLPQKHICLLGVEYVCTAVVLHIAYCVFIS